MLRLMDDERRVFLPYRGNDDGVHPIEYIMNDSLVSVLREPRHVSGRIVREVSGQLLERLGISTSRPPPDTKDRSAFDLRECAEEQVDALARGMRPEVAEGERFIPIPDTAPSHSSRGKFSSFPWQEGSLKIHSCCKYDVGIGIASRDHRRWHMSR